MRASRAWREFRSAGGMRVDCPNPATLRAEARVLAIAGAVLLAIGFPPTILLAAEALTTDGVSPFLPAAVGAPPLMLGYLACWFASQRLMRARAMDALTPRLTGLAAVAGNC